VKEKTELRILDSASYFSVHLGYWKMLTAFTWDRSAVADQLKLNPSD